MQQSPPQQPPMQPQNSGAGGAAGELRSDAQQIGSKAPDRLHSEVDARKGTAATQVKSVSKAIQNAAGQLDDGAPAWLRSAFQQAADQFQRFAETLEQKDSRQILDEMQSFARQRPGFFLGACAAAGFAASRVVKAGGERQASQQFGGSASDRSQPWGDGETDGFTQSFEEARPGDSQPFIAAGNTERQGASQRPSGATDEPLIL